MVRVRLEEKEAFNIIGIKTWISDHNDFGKFWGRCHQEGHIKEIKKFNKTRENSQTQSPILGLSCTEELSTQTYMDILHKGINCTNDDCHTQYFCCLQRIWQNHKKVKEVKQLYYDS